MTGADSKPTRRAPPPLNIRARSFSRRDGAPAPVPGLLSRPEQAQLMSIASLVEYPTPGSTIFTEGEEVRFLFVVVQGVVRVTHHLESGDRQILSFMWPGDVCGLAELGRYANSAETLTPAALYRMPLEPLHRALVRHPRLQLHLLAKAAHELRAAQRQIILLGRKGIECRLAAFLLDLCQQFHFFNPQSGELRLPMTRFDIADYLSTKAETVTRAFTRLEEQGVLTRLSPKHLRIVNQARLAELGR